MQRRSHKRDYFFQKTDTKTTLITKCDDCRHIQRGKNMTQCHTNSTHLAEKSATKAECDKTYYSKTLWHALCLIFSRSGRDPAASKHD
jgi:hypothetical protein